MFPFDSREKLRKPRHCSQFRMFTAFSAMCDFEYSAKMKCNEPVRPDLLGLHAIAYSDFFPIDQPIDEALIFELGSAGGFHQCDASLMVFAVGIEFSYFGKTAPEGRFVKRALIVG